MDEKSVAAQLEALDLELKQTQLEHAKMTLEQAKQTVADFQAQKATRSRQNAQRQSQLRRDLIERAEQSKACSHRQGGPLKSRTGGKRESALSAVIFPDERMLIMCSICPLRVWSPFPGNKSRKQQGGETRQEAIARAEQYARDKADFDKLFEASQEKLTPEAAQPMFCGVTFKFADGEGREIPMPAPCDSYAQGLDSRKGVAA